MLVKYYSIKVTPEFSDTFEAHHVSGEVMDDADLLNGAVGEIYEFGKDEPEWIEDIRGQIQNEPDRVFVELTTHGDETHAMYFGLTNAA